MENNYLTDIIKQLERKMIRDILIKTIGVSEPAHSDYQSVFTMPIKNSPHSRQLWYKNDVLGTLNYSMEYNEATSAHTININFIPKRK